MGSENIIEKNYDIFGRVKNIIEKNYDILGRIFKNIIQKSMIFELKIIPTQKGKIYENRIPLFRDTEMIILKKYELNSLKFPLGS